MKKISLSVIILLISLSVYSQKTNKIWDALLKNDRTTALELANKIKIKNATLEQLLLKSIVQTENGLTDSDNSEFLKAFSTKKNFDYFLFSLWKENFLFKNYLEVPFDKQIRDRVAFFDTTSISNSTVKGGLQYLDAIAKRSVNNFEVYKKNIQDLHAVNQWQYCGVFENLNKSGIDIPYPPETIAYSKKDFNANSNGFINWFTPSYLKNSAYQFFANHSEYGSGINYAQTFFNLPTEKTLIFKVGLGNSAKIWLNDVLIFHEPEQRITELDAHSIKVKVPKGNNRLLVKVNNGSYSYFIMRVFDENNKLIIPTELNFTSAYSPYNKINAKDLNFEVLPNKIETFFKNLDTKKYTSYFKDILLIKTYLRNGKGDSAEKIVKKLLEKHPKSSYLRRIYIDCLNTTKDYTTAKEVLENRKNDDPDYYFNLLIAFTETNKLFKLPVSEMNEKLDKIKASTDSKIVKLTADFMKEIRNQNKEALRVIIDKTYNESKRLENAKLLSTYAKAYESLFNDSDKTLKLLENINSKYFSVSVANNLIYRYNKLNKKDKVIALLQDYVAKLPEEINIINRIARQLQSYEKYKESLKYIDRGLEMFPYSFSFMKLKADALLQLKRKKEALALYKKSFSYDSGNASLRKTINDLDKKIDPIKEVALKEPYKFIKQYRNKDKDKNFPLRILLDEKNVQLYKEGGSKNRSIYIYEIKSEKGIERLKEYNLNLGYGYTINKSEIVKPDGKIIPAEKSGSKFVFNNLAIDDVILIDFETHTNKTGRFYKDYTDTYQMRNQYPTVHTIYRLITPKGFKINSKVTNGKVNYTKTNIKDFDLFEWKVSNLDVLKPYEDYMPQDIDIATTLYLSTIDSWNEIANWYSDLVRTQIEENETVNSLFNKLFPNGFTSLTEEERAKIIYQYMMNNLTYSFVDFKQSGYIPQKPSKTIKTLLGDCKDFSTLFLILAKKANIETNLVLISTNDNGEKYMQLPSIKFNHCIVRTILDGKEQYLELTDKNLPFKSLPNSLEGANALNIPFMPLKNNETVNLITLHNSRQIKTEYKAETELTINDNKQNLKIKLTSSGKLNSPLRDLLTEANQEKLSKKIVSYFEDRENLDLSLNDIKIIEKDKNADHVIFFSDFKINNEIKKLGKYKLIKLPIFSKAYTNNIINLETRNYPIVYAQYERTDHYLYTYTIKLGDENKGFKEIPENESYHFKKHKFSINYTLVNNKQLDVKMEVFTDKSNISPQDYQSYKKYVKNVLEASNSFIGFN